MKLKETYTLEELCTNLTIPLVKFCQMAGITEATLIRLRKGYAGRQHTINSILATFSKVYDRDLSLENVTGLTVQEKPHQKVLEAPVEKRPIAKTTQPEIPQISTTEPKRAYVRKKESGLPEDAISATEFGLNHGVKRETFRDHMNFGLGLGIIHGPDVPENGSVQIKDYVRFEERSKRVRKDGTIEKERYLTADQQRDAITFWKRHDVAFTECNDIGCRCHTVKNGEE